MIHVFSTWSEAYASLAELTYFQNKLLYAKKQNYESSYVIHTDPNNVLWGRVEEWLKKLKEIPEGDWLYFSGTDAFITNPSYRLEDYINTTKDFMCCVDRHQVFGDTFLIKSCKTTKELLKEILDNKNKYPNEQIAFSTILSRSDTFENYCNKVGHHDFGTHDFYKRSESILNTTNVQVGILDNLGAKKIVGDLEWVHDAGLWVVPPYHAWYPDTFSLHLGGKSLHFRLGIIPYLTRDLVF